MTPTIFSNHILDEVTPFQFKDTALIPIKVNLEKLFGTNQIQFQISIKNRKIIIESPQVLADLDLQDNPQEKEILNVN